MVSLTEGKVMNDSLATIIVALIMSIPGSLALFKQWKKDKAEADKIRAESETQEADATEKIQTAALKMMEVYKKEVEELKERIEKAEIKIRKLEKELESEKETKEYLTEEKRKIIVGSWKLYDQVTQTGSTPAYTPPDTA